MPAVWHESLAVHVTGFEPVQTPLAQAYVWSHGFEPVQFVPSVAVGLEHVPLDGSQVPATWQASDAVQTTGFEPVQVPPWQESDCVHPFPSLQVVPFDAVGFEQEPVLGLHVPTAWHWSLAVHVTGFDPVQVPLWQESLWVQALPSLQVVPFVAVGFEQEPLLGLHVPATWHWSLAVHVTGFEPVHVPLWHESVCVHAFPSLQVVPFAAFGFEQVPVLGLQVPATWHWSAAVHVTGFEPVQVPLWQESVCVQALPSLQLVPFAAVGLEHAPVLGSHVPATWHWSSAVHVTGFDPVQVPDSH